MEEEFRTVRNVGGGEHHVGVQVHNLEFCHAADYYIYAILILHCTQFVDFQTTIVLRSEVTYGSDIACHTTDVERTEGKLSTRFTD